MSILENEQKIYFKSVKWVYIYLSPCSQQSKKQLLFLFSKILVNNPWGSFLEG